GISACSNPQALDAGKIIRGNLQAGEKDCYSFTAISGEGLDFYVESEILMVLTLYDQTGQVIASVGDTGDNFNPHLVTTIPADGTYFFTISILGRTGSGEYSLRMESLRASESCIQGAQQVAIGNVIDGEFLPDEQSCYSLAGNSGESVLLWVEAEVDTQLVLYLPNGIELTRDDDSGGDTNPRLVTTLPDDGIYTIAVEGYGPISGAFILHIEASVPGTNAFDNALELAWNTRTSGAITSGSYIYLDEFQYGTHGVLYTFLGSEGDKIQIDVLAGSINSLLDPVFYLLDAEHVSLTTDDDSGTGHDSKVIYTLPYTGQYFILVEDIQDRYGDPASYYFEILLSH
ncbi:MAG TPA: PPC domain-containing protein, partial [Anaerolineales bacterium]